MARGNIVIRDVTNGDSSATDVAWSNSADGTTNFSTTYFTNALYRGEHAISWAVGTTRPTQSTTASDYTWARARGDNGGTGPSGTPAPRSLTIPVYYERSTSPQGTAPNGDINATYNFNSGAFTNLATTNDVNRWQTIAPTANLDGTNVYWQGTITFTETITNNARSGVSPATDVQNISRGFLFDGVVRFTNSATITDGTTTTNINTVANAAINANTVVNTALTNNNTDVATNATLGNNVTVNDNQIGGNVNTQGNSLPTTTNAVLNTGNSFNTRVNASTTTIDGGRINTGVITGGDLTVNTTNFVPTSGSGFDLRSSTGGGSLTVGNTARYMLYDGTDLILHGGAFQTSSGGTAGISYLQGAPPAEALPGSTFYRTTDDRYYIVLEDDNGNIFFRQFATGSGDLFPSGVNTMPSVANFFGSPTNTYNTATSVNISHLNDE